MKEIRAPPSGTFPTTSTQTSSIRTSATQAISSTRTNTKDDETANASPPSTGLREEMVAGGITTNITALHRGLRSVFLYAWALSMGFCCWYPISIWENLLLFWLLVKRVVKLRSVVVFIEFLLNYWTDFEHSTLVPFRSTPFISIFWDLPYIFIRPILFYEI